MSICDVCTNRIAGDVRQILNSKTSGDCKLCLGLFEGLSSRVKEEISRSGFHDVHEVQLCLKLDLSMTLRSLIETAFFKSDTFVDIKDAIKLLVHPSIPLVKFDDPSFLPPLKVEISVEFEKCLSAVNRFRGVKELVAALGSLQYDEICTKLSIPVSECPNRIDNLVSALDSLCQLNSLKVKVEISRESLFLLGKYKKNSRDIAQSRWLVEGSDFQPAGSVEEIVEEWLAGVLGADIKPRESRVTLSASGREDVDVRMLGTGRDFCVEISNPVSLSNFAGKRKIGDFPGFSRHGVEISDLRLVDRRVLGWLHYCAENHTKFYQAVVLCKEPLTLASMEKLQGIKDLEICQWTPVRVLHRRANMLRKKTLHSINVKMIDNENIDLSTEWCISKEDAMKWKSCNLYVITLESSAGMYIKEFVHGDFGRTSPSLKDLLTESPNVCDILTLDVLEVEAVEYPFDQVVS